MKIGIDLDEVVVEFVKGYLEFFNLRYKKNFCFEDVFTYDLWKVLGISKEESFKLAYEFFDSESFEDIEVVWGAKEAIQKLTVGHDLFFITSRPTHTEIKTRNFFKKNFPAIRPYVFHSNERFGGWGKTKNILCRNLKIDLFIEDQPAYALACAEEGIRVFLMDKPWNQNIKHNNLLRVNDWEEVMGKLNFLVL